MKNSKRKMSNENGIMKDFNLGILNIWTFKILKSTRFEKSNLWKIENLKIWKFEFINLESWKLEILKF